MLGANRGKIVPICQTLFVVECFLCRLSGRRFSNVAVGPLTHRWRWKHVTVGTQINKKQLNYAHHVVHKDRVNRTRINVEVQYTIAKCHKRISLFPVSKINLNYIKLTDWLADWLIDCICKLEQSYTSACVIHDFFSFFLSHNLKRSKSFRYFC